MPKTKDKSKSKPKSILKPSTKQKQSDKQKIIEKGKANNNKNTNKPTVTQRKRKQLVYLDNNGTTRPCPAAQNTMVKWQVPMELEIFLFFRQRI